MVCENTQTTDGEVGLGVSSLGSMNDAIDMCSRLKARTLYDSHVARPVPPVRLATDARAPVPCDPTVRRDTVTSLWMSVIDTTGTGDVRESCANPRANCFSRCRCGERSRRGTCATRARAREGGSESCPIPSIRPDVASCSPSSQLFLTEIRKDGISHTRRSSWTIRCFPPAGLTGAQSAH